MSENKKNPIIGEAISVEQLAAVTGGGNGYNASDPLQSITCWFRGNSAQREDGRTRCMSDCKGKFSLDDGRAVSPNDSGIWIVCPCWGTDNCVDKWHKPCGKDSRTDW